MTFKDVGDEVEYSFGCSDIRESNHEPVVLNRVESFHAIKWGHVQRGRFWCVGVMKHCPYYRDGSVNSSGECETGLGRGQKGLPVEEVI